MLITSLLEGTNTTVLAGEKFSLPSYEIRGITVDSRKACDGYIFAAIKGYIKNGIDYIPDAYKRGARVFLSEELIETPNDCLVIKCKNARKTLAEISSRLYGNPQKHLKLIGVTGTKGKTTAGYFISRLLSLSGVSAFFIGTLGFADSNGRILHSTDNTTPEPTELFFLLSECVRLGANTVVIEASSQALRDFRLFGISFFGAVFTSLGVDHIGKSEHSSFTEYAEMKRSLFTSYGAKFGFFNSDDFYCAYMAAKTEKCIKCGFGKSADYRIESIKGGFLLNGIEVYPRLPGEYNARNIALALAVCKELYSIPLLHLAPLVSDITVRGRFEHRTVRGRHVVIDYAHNAMSFREVIGLARRLFGGKIIAVFGSVGGRSSERRRELAESAEQLADYSVITSDDPAYENAEEICREIYSNYNDKSRAEIVVDRERAIRRAFSLSCYGDTLLLLGKGHEEYIRRSGRRVYFSERRVLDLLDKSSIL